MDPGFWTAFQIRVHKPGQCVITQGAPNSPGRADMSELQTEAWIVTNRREIVRYEVDPDRANFLRIDLRIRFTAECPRGHKMPFAVTANEKVVRTTAGTGVTLACGKCDPMTNYTLDLGEWPSPFPAQVEAK
jgi:hypothetical protein